MSVTTYGFDTLALQSNAKVRNQVDFGSETRQNRHGLRAAGTYIQCAVRANPVAILFCYCVSRGKSPQHTISKTRGNMFRAIMYTQTNAISVLYP